MKRVGIAAIVLAALVAGLTALAMLTTGGSGTASTPAPGPVVQMDRQKLTEVTFPDARCVVVEGVGRQGLGISCWPIRGAR